MTVEQAHATLVYALGVEPQDIDAAGLADILQGLFWEGIVGVVGISTRLARTIRKILRSRRCFMSKKPEPVDRVEHTTLRVEGSAQVARLQELLGKEPALKLEIVAPRASPLRAATGEVKP